MEQRELLCCLYGFSIAGWAAMMLLDGLVCLKTVTPQTKAWNVISMFLTSFSQDETWHDRFKTLHHLRALLDWTNHGPSALHSQFGLLFISPVLFTPFHPPVFIGMPVFVHLLLDKKAKVFQYFFKEFHSPISESFNFPYLPIPGSLLWTSYWVPLPFRQGCGQFLASSGQGALTSIYKSCLRLETN